MNKTLLEVTKLHISYDAGQSYILRDISFDLREWEILSIIGKNGTGKSSLLKAIAWVQKYHSGSIHKKTSHISYIPQKIYLEESFPLTVWEFFSVFNENISQRKLQDTLKLFWTQKFLERNIHSLSGWEFQKVLITNALLSDPDIMLLDEPTSWIDIIWEEQFYENIMQIQKVFPKMSIILVSHNLSLVYKNSTRVICLHENNLCCHGTPNELMNNKDLGNIFGSYLRPYEHAPHAAHHHTH